MNFKSISFIKVLLFIFLASLIFLFFVSKYSDYLLPQYSKSFFCASSGRGKVNFGYDKCNFVTTYLYYIATVLTAIFGVILGFLPQFRENLQAKRFRDLVFFVCKTIFFGILICLLIAGIFYLGFFVWSNYLRNNL